MEALELKCRVQQYEWGKIGNDSLVFRLAAGNFPAELDPMKPCAELWVGTHANLPSIAKVDGEEVELKHFMNEKYLSSYIYDKYGDLPFLFKVLSIRKPLSIQSHPDKELAKKLHLQNPEAYRDPNHKPEMILSVTHFKAYVGFKPYEILRDTVKRIPELQRVIGEKGCNRYFTDDVDPQDPKAVEDALKFSVSSILDCSRELMSSQLQSLEKKILEGNLPQEDRNIGILLKNYPSDPGCMFALLMNYVELNPGEAVFLGVNEPHCYVWGDGIECMATSDNVIRVGCTPKHKDLELFCNSVSYTPRFPNKMLISPRPSAGTKDLKLYCPPIPEFLIAGLDTVLPEDGVTISSMCGPCVALVLSEHSILFCGKKASRGSVFFVPAHTSIQINPVDKSEDRTLIYLASPNTINYPPHAC